MEILCCAANRRARSRSRAATAVTSTSDSSAAGFTMAMGAILAAPSIPTLTLAPCVSRGAFSSLAPWAGSDTTSLLEVEDPRGTLCPRRLPLRCGCDLQGTDFFIDQDGTVGILCIQVELGERIWPLLGEFRALHQPT